MGRFEGYLLVSDFDGTLIDHQLCISDENIDAVRSFIDQGGRFLGATGRTELNVRPYTDGLPLSSPWILYNGAAIYDWESESFLYKALLDRPLSESFVIKVMARFPGVNIQVFTGGPFCQVNAGALPDAQAVREGQHFENKPMEQVADDWLKVLFCDEKPEHIDVIEAMLEDDPLLSCVHKTRSAPRYFELTATGANKGTALVRLKQLLDPTPLKVVAIGDYLNDVEMLIEADISAAPESALPEVKAHAQIITVDHTQSAIADLVAKLESGLRG
jgi:Cof subfamily protein (haloacid dehalogenase superfamily)